MPDSIGAAGLSAPSVCLHASRTARIISSRQPAGVSVRRAEPVEVDILLLAHRTPVRVAVLIEVEEILETVGVATTRENRFVADRTNTLVTVETGQVGCAGSSAAADAHRRRHQGRQQLTGRVAVLQVAQGPWCAFVFAEGGFEKSQILEHHALSDTDEPVGTLIENGRRDFFFFARQGVFGRLPLDLRPTPRWYRRQLDCSTPDGGRVLSGKEQGVGRAEEGGVIPARGR